MDYGKDFACVADHTSSVSHQRKPKDVCDSRLSTGVDIQPPDADANHPSVYGRRGYL